MTAPDRRPVRQRLAEHYSAEELRLFLAAAQPALGGAVPAQLIANGRAEEVHVLIDRMEGA